MKTNYLIIIGISIIGLLSLYGEKNDAFGMCVQGIDWPDKPCYGCPGCYPGLEQEKIAWEPYYDYKGSKWMELKKQEMNLAIQNDTLPEWIDLTSESQAHRNVHTYYFLQGEVLRHGMTFSETKEYNKVSNARENNSSISLDRTIYHLTLKQQIEHDVKSSEIRCPNDSHILAKRDSGELACISPYSMVKLDWEPTRYSYYIESVMKEDKQYNVFAYFSQTKNIDGLKYDNVSNSLTIFVFSDEPEKLSIKLKKGLLDVGTDLCPASQFEYPNYDDYFVLINGEEVVYDERITTEKYRYLEIQIDIASNDPDVRAYAEELHDYLGMQYHVNSKIIEIIGTCPI